MMSNSLDPDQARRFVGPDLGPSYQQTTMVDKELNDTGFGPYVHVV